MRSCICVPLSANIGARGECQARCTDLYSAVSSGRDLERDTDMRPGTWQIRALKLNPIPDLLADTFLYYLDLLAFAFMFGFLGWDLHKVVCVSFLNHEWGEKVVCFGNGLFVSRPFA